MLTAVISDIHSNLQALEAVLAAIDAEGVDEIWCLGDLVGYGADPGPCVEILRERTKICLAGNHDLAAIGSIPTDVFTQGAAAAAAWTTEALEPEQRSWLASLKPEGERAGAGLYHGSPRDPVWEYVLSSLAAEMCLDDAGRPFVLVGHSHVALAFSRRPGQPATGETQRAGTVLDLRGAEWIINPGSVGQPRDGDPRAAWLLLDLTDGKCEFRREEYDIQAAQSAIRTAGLPESLADRLRLGV
ncbi:MAG: metallophosphoesterase family protein [Actinomycetes bacterium]